MNTKDLIKLMKKKIKEAEEEVRDDNPCYDDKGGYYEIGYANGMKAMLWAVEKLLKD